MLTDGLARARVFVRPGGTDIRKQINGQTVLVEQELGLDPFEHAVFLFCNRQRRILRAIYWDQTGFAMWRSCAASHNCQYRIQLLLDSANHRYFHVRKSNMIYRFRNWTLVRDHY